MNNEEKILEILFENSNKEFHIRKLARLTKLNPNTIINITNKLLNKKLISKKKDEDTNRVLIKANLNNEFKLKKQFYNIKKIINSGLIEYLNNTLAFPSIFLFGSYAKSENHKNSDIDLFIICDKIIKIDLSYFEKKLNCEIQLFIHNKEEFIKMKKDNKELLNNVLNGIKLSGYLDIF